MSQKFYNFLDHRLRPKVSCDVPFSDDPENLLLQSPKEFVAYNVVKPPAELHFKFICKVNIYCIKIFTKVGSLKSTHIEVSGDGELGRIAYGTCEKEHEDGVCFIRNGLNLKNEEFLRGIDRLNTSKFFKTLRPTKDLKVTIKRTMRCTPVLSRIEIWGCLARDCTIMELELVEKLWNVMDPRIISEQKPSQSLNTIHSQEFVIPDEFLDQITCELMSLPMTLPSGKIIDERTLERCQELDIASGRTVSDPFSGQPFTSERKAVFNAGLKARIDKFLMNHADKQEVKNVPRTTGNYIRRDDLVPRSNSYQNALSRVELTRGMSFKAQLAVALAAIRQTKSNAPKEELPRGCSGCQTTTHLYKNKTCVHLICRRCLLGSKETRLRCQSCSNFFKRSDVEKFHEVIR